MFDPRAYWEARYVAGGDSGPGSSKNEGRFKSNLVGSLIDFLQVESIIDFGCGDGQLMSEALSGHSGIHYTGIDFSPKALELSESKIGRLQGINSRFVNMDPSKGQPTPVADLAICLDVLFHIKERADASRLMMRVLNSFTKAAVLTMWTDDVLNEEPRLARHVFYHPISIPDGFMVKEMPIGQETYKRLVLIFRPGTPYVMEL